jgi:hypothetical protein
MCVQVAAYSSDLDFSSLASSLSTTTKSSSASVTFCFLVEGSWLSSASAGSVVGASGSWEASSEGSVDCFSWASPSVTTGGKKLLHQISFENEKTFAVDLRNVLEISILIFLQEIAEYHAIQLLRLTLFIKKLAYSLQSNLACLSARVPVYSRTQSRKRDALASCINRQL